MIDGKTVLAVITARGGSKGLPRKNVLPAAGKPLIAWTIEAARAACTLDRTVLSSDDPEIIAVARQWGCEVPFVRPAELAQDDSPVDAALLHALDALGRGYDYLVLLQATSPQRLGEDIDGCVRRCVEAGAPACVSVCEPAKSPYWSFRLDGGGRLKPLLGADNLLKRRQDLPPAFVPNGAVYVAEVAWWCRHRRFYAPGTVAHVMPADRSLDVDTATDLALFELLHRRERA